MYFIFEPSFMKISFTEVLSRHEKFTKGNNFIKKCDRAKVLVFCIPVIYDETLYLYQVSLKYLLQFEDIEPTPLSN